MTEGIKKARLSCPACNKKFLSSKYQEGKVYKCPACQGVLEFSGYKDEEQESTEPQQITKSSQKQALQKRYDFILEQLKTGVDKLIIFRKLVGMGVDQDDAKQMIETVLALIEATEEKKPAINPVATALIGGLIAAIVAGGAWGLIVISTGYEIGYVAWGIGLLAGFVVALASQGRKGFSYQIIAVLSGIIGIVIGKYLTFYHVLKSQVASTVSVFSVKVIEFLVNNFSELITVYDFLWFILAIITAWGVCKRVNVKWQL